MRQWLTKRIRRSHRDRQPNGYILATVIGLGLILIVSVTAVSIRAAAEKTGSSQSNQISVAQSAAETGIERLYAMLNNGPYQSLASRDLSGWNAEITNINTVIGASNSRQCGLPTSASTTQTLSSLTSGQVTSTSTGDLWWELINYQAPSSTNGNTATVVMEGGLGGLNNRRTQRTRIERRYSSGPGPSALRTPTANAALFAGGIDLGNNDVLSSDASQGCANVYCVNCNANRGPNSVVEGAVLRLPEGSQVPEPRVWPTSGATAANGYYDRLNQTNPFGTPPVLRVSDFSNTDANGFINIRVNNVPPGLKVINNTCGGANSNPTRLPNNSVAGCKRVAIYFEGNITGSIEQVFSDSSSTFLPYPENLVLYGLPSTDSRGQNLTLGGGGPKIQSALIVAPKVRAGINGGPPRSRTDPDIYGPLYVGIWDRSNSNNAEIVVPYDMYQRIDETLIPNLNNVSTGFSLRATTSWRKGGSFQ